MLLIRVIRVIRGCVVHLSQEIPMHALPTLLLSLAMSAAPPGQGKFDAEAHAKAVAPFLEERTFAVLHVDLTRLDPASIVEFAATVIRTDAKELRGMRESLDKVTGLARDAGDLYVVFSLADIPDSSPFGLLTVPNEKRKALIDKLREDINTDRIEVADFDAGVVIGAPETVKRLRDHKPVARPEVAKAFANAGPGFVHAVAVPPRELPRILEELLPNLPPELGGDSVKVVTRGFQSVGLGIEPPPKLHARLVIQASDKDAARQLNELLNRAIALAVKTDAARIGPGIDKLAKALTPKVEGDRLVLEMDQAHFVKAFEEPAERVKAAAERTRSQNNLKQIGLAMHNYHDTNGAFPTPANYGKGDKPLLSWRVHLLPYLDQDALYKEFHLDEPWDSDHNKKLIARMPDVFRSSTDKKLAKDGKTTYLVPLGKETMFPGGKGVRIADITDGTSNTIMVLDAADEKAVTWTKPDDLEIDPKAPAKGLAARFNDTFLLGFADGSVRGLKKDIDKDTLWALFTIAGGEVVNIP
jgi:hypothetical protein